MHRSTKIIKIRMLELGLSLDALVRAYNEEHQAKTGRELQLPEMSMCINCTPMRIYPQVREWLCRKLKLDYNRTWGKPAHNAANRRRAARQEARRAA